jgi:hypothetical protein
VTSLSNCLSDILAFHLSPLGLQFLLRICSSVKKFLAGTFFQRMSPPLAKAAGDFLQSLYQPKHGISSSFLDLSDCAIILLLGLPIFISDRLRISRLSLLRRLGLCLRLSEGLRECRLVLPRRYLA